MSKQLIFDGHNDVLSKIADAGDPAALDRFINGSEWHLDLPKMARGGFAGGFFAIWGPTPGDDDDFQHMMRQAEYDVPMAGPLSQADAMVRLARLSDILLQLDRRGKLKICRTAADVSDCMDRGTIAAIFHIEGAEAIGEDLAGLDLLYAAGLRSIGPVWSRNTVFCDGVPFRFPSTGDTGGGLTDAGKALIRRCNQLGVLIDLSHMTEAGFWDVAKLSTKPLVASHSNAHAVCPHARNLTDEQLKAVAKSGGIVGLNFASAFLRPDGQMNSDVDLSVMLDHLDHMIDVMGDIHVGLGSDYDGATVPDDLIGAHRLPLLIDAMSDHGYSDGRINRIAQSNWLRVLKKTFGA